MACISTAENPSDTGKTMVQFHSCQRVIRTVASTPVFQTGDKGSIPLWPSGIRSVGDDTEDTLA